MLACSKWQKKNTEQWLILTWCGTDILVFVTYKAASLFFRDFFLQGFIQKTSHFSILCVVTRAEQRLQCHHSGTSLSALEYSERGSRFKGSACVSKLQCPSVFGPADVTSFLIVRDMLSSLHLPVEWLPSICHHSNTGKQRREIW